MNLNVFGQNSQHQCQCLQNFGSTVTEYLFWKMRIKFPIHVLSILLLKGFSKKTTKNKKPKQTKQPKTKTQTILAIFFPKLS